MITENEAESIIDYAVGYAAGKAEEVELTVTGSDVACSRFANNSMTQNQSPDRSRISIRVIKDGRQIRVESDDLSQSSVRQLIDDALTALKHLEIDESLLPLPAAAEGGYAQLHRFDRDTAELDAHRRAEEIAKILRIAKASELLAAGILSSGSNILCIGNSRGLFASHLESYAACSITMSNNGSTGWSKAEEISFADLNCEALAQKAASTAAANRDPVEISPGKYRVILEPAAVLDLLGYLSWDFAATSHVDRLSCLLGKLGKQVFGKNISIMDDCLHPLQSGAAFDGEGLPRQSVTLVENGVLKNLVACRRSAAALGVRATGHGLEEPNIPGETPANLVFGGGSTSLDEMIAGEEHAILLKRVWYIREVDPALKIVTGMTRDGCFLVENGKVVKALKNLRFNESLIELLNNVIAMGPSARVSGGEEGGPAVLPPMLVDKFNFSSTTTF